MKPQNLMIQFVVLLVMAITSRDANAATIWSTGGATCTPVSYTGYNVSAGAVTAGAGTTVTLYCAVGKSETTAGAYNKIEIIHKGTTSGTTVNIQADLIRLDRSTGTETVLATVTGGSSATVISSSAYYLTTNAFDWNTYFYYVKVRLTSGVVAGQLQTLYGVSLLWI